MGRTARAITGCILACWASAAHAEIDLPADVASGWQFERSLKIGFKPWGFKVVNVKDGYPVRSGQQSLRFEVRPGDCGRNSIGHDDCATDRERHELVQVGRNQVEGDDWWYAWSIFVPHDYPNVYPTKVALGQFHQHPEVIWMFRNRDGGYFVNRQQELGRGYGFDRILDDKSLRGRWNDILVHVKWTHTKMGTFRVWVNEKKAYDYRGPTMGKNTTAYFKFGIYRTFISRYMVEHGVSSVPTQVVYFDEVRRGHSRQEVTRGLRSRR
jgi:hypothetical protein